MNILITGLGALGTVFGCMLKKAGHTVHALTKDKYLSALRERKVSVSGIWGAYEAVLDGIHSSIDPLRTISFDLIILTVKSFDTRTAIEQVRPLVGRDTLVIVAQNGYGNYEAVSEAVGKEHTLLARVIFGVKLHALRHGRGHGHCGRRPDRPAARRGSGRTHPEIAIAINRSGVPTSYAENITAVLWDKILYNAALNPLGAILECTYGQLSEHEGSRQIMDRVIDEIFIVTQAHGIRLNWRTPEEYRLHFYTKLVPPTAKHFPSMYYDVKAGKRTEIDALNGAIVRLATKGILFR
jgi:2-dehydropantoate 2-reductase